MLTTHRGERENYSAASAMARHLQQQTLTAAQGIAQHRTLGDGSYDQSRCDAAPRRDVDPHLAALLAVDPRRHLEPLELVRLLAGRRADGDRIPGLASMRTRATIGAALCLDATRPPDRTELGHLLAGRRADGSVLPEKHVRAARRVIGLLGIPNGQTPTPRELDQIALGRRVDGSALSWSRAARFAFVPRTSVGYLGFCVSAHKSVSLGWALAGSQSEAALIVQSHRDATTAMLLYMEQEIGLTRRGKAGAGGHEPGPLLWVTLEHYTARPTLGDEQVGEGNGAAEGMPQLHSHIVIPNVTRTETGHVGALDIQRLSGRLKTYGAIYQAHLATRLRALGAQIELDPDTGAACLSSIPEKVWRHFSQRTAEGTRAAQRRIAEQRQRWEDLPERRRVALIKQGIQGDPRAPKRDDLGDPVAWNARVVTLGWQPTSLLRPERPVLPLDGPRRLDLAYDIASEILADALERNRGLTFDQVRLSAARGLVASGIGAAADVEAVTRRISQSGIKTRKGLITITPSTARSDAGWGRLTAASDGGTQSEDVVYRDDGVSSTAVLAGQEDIRERSVTTQLRSRLCLRLIAGGYTDLLEAAADFWEERLHSHQDARSEPEFVTDTREAARALTHLLRARRQRDGLLGPDHLRVQATDRDDEPIEVALALGDRLRLGCRLYAEGKTMGRGLFARDGSTVRVQDLDPVGITLLNQRGRAGLVRWERLRDPRSGRYLVEHAGVTTLQDVQKWPGKTHCVLVMSEGSRRPWISEILLPNSGRSLSLSVLLPEDIERRRATALSAAAEPGTVAHALWTAALANLIQAPGATGSGGLLRRIAELRTDAVRTLLSVTLIHEQRDRDGVEPTTMHRMLQQRGDEAGLRASMIEPALRKQAAIRDGLATVLSMLPRQVTTAINGSMMKLPALLRQARKRREAWLLRTTLRRTLEHQHAEEAVGGFVGSLRSSVVRRDHVIATLTKTAVALPELSNVSFRPHLEHIVHLNRSRRAEWLEKSTLSHRFERWAEKGRITTVMFNLSFDVLSRNKKLQQFNLAITEIPLAVAQAAAPILPRLRQFVAATRKRRAQWLRSNMLSQTFHRAAETRAVYQAIIHARFEALYREQKIRKLSHAMLELPATIERSVTPTLSHLRDAVMAARERRARWRDVTSLAQKWRARREEAALSRLIDEQRSAAAKRSNLMTTLQDVVVGLKTELARNMASLVSRLVMRLNSKRTARADANETAGSTAGEPVERVTPQLSTVKRPVDEAQAPRTNESARADAFRALEAQMARRSRPEAVSETSEPAAVRGALPRRSPPSPEDLRRTVEPTRAHVARRIDDRPEESVSPVRSAHHWVFPPATIRKAAGHDPRAPGQPEQRPPFASPMESDIQHDPPQVGGLQAAAVRRGVIGSEELQSQQAPKAPNPPGALPSPAAIARERIDQTATAAEAIKLGVPVDRVPADEAAHKHTEAARRRRQALPARGRRDDGPGW